MSFNVFSFDRLPKFNKPIYLIGVFESFHLGHNALYEKAKEIKKNSNSDRDIVIVFFKDIENMPKSISGYIFSDFENRIQEFANIGFKNGIYLEFSKIWNLEADAFIDKLLTKQNKDNFNIVIGEDFRFGARAKGNPDFLINKLGKDKVSIVPTLHVGSGIKISTSFIKKCIEIGDIELINSLNLYLYSFNIELKRNEDSAIVEKPKNLIPLRNANYLCLIEIDKMTYYAVLKYDSENLEVRFLDFKIKNWEKMKARIKIIKPIRFFTDINDEIISNEDLKNAKFFLLNNGGKLW
ncbi:FAD synthase [Mycoplasma tauri]|uniref:FAD synthase n=1 Tax=Mycoplasma tauri TaxID=547987 RepID=UPI00196741CF|nr:hypothetical protein [Mycoplasma tauri]MBZ4203676.1 hypothetical protein [Mycoplasma tauri]MBZ4204493.1 hypothetical protein [Mycoplasma tauri]MBZ4218513.1 hypothetical protein [Mycoplasma tauri]MBZ4226877.1 hypothetical protein [Mycoplasma tauri]QSB07560.1 hypothetical protein JS510_00285 [Mycoplasma tauri]